MARLPMVPLLVLLVALLVLTAAAAGGLATAEAGLSLLWPTPIHSSTSPASRRAAALLKRAVPALLAVDPGVRKSNKNSHGWHSSELLGYGAPELHRRLGGAESASVGAVAAVEAAVAAAARQMVAQMGAARFGLLLGLPPPPPSDDADGVDVFVQNLWANVNNQSDFNIMHTHPKAVLSGALYLDADEGGRLEFADPRPLVQCPRTDDPRARDALFMVCAWCPEHLCARGAGLNPRRLLDSAAPKAVAPTAGLLLLWPSWLPHRVAPQPLNRSRISVSFNVWVQRRTQPGARPPTASLEAHEVAAQRAATEAFLSAAKQLSAEPADVGDASSNHSLTMHWPTWVQEATLEHAAPAVKGLKSALKAWANARVAWLASEQEQNGDEEGEDLFAPRVLTDLAPELQELKDWVGGVAANIIEQLSVTIDRGPATAAQCPQVQRVRALLVRQPADSARLPLQAPAWAARGRPHIAGLFVVNARCKSKDSTSAASSPPPPFVLDVHDPRPEAEVDLAPMDSGKTLRWLPGRGGRGGDLLLYPAWLHHALSLPPNDCQHARTFLIVFVELSSDEAGGEGGDSVWAGDLSRLVLTGK